MNRSALRAVALVLPLLGLAGTWTWTHVRAQQGTEWDVPIAGYDPRALLRADMGEGPGRREAQQRQHERGGAKRGAVHAASPASGA